VQSLVDSLHAGQTGCLLSGSYGLSGELRIGRGGRKGLTLTLRSAPGAFVRLIGGPIEVAHTANHVTIAGLHIDTRGSGQVGVQILGADDALIGDDITNENTPYSCIILGSDTGYGRAVRPLVASDVVHQCGYNPSDPYEDHGIYVDNSVGARITGNRIWGMPYGWGVQLYPDAQHSQVTHNVIVGNGQGVVIGGNSHSASSYNTVAYNVIGDSFRQHDLQSWWGGRIGTGNVARRNCVYSAREGAIERPAIGFVARENVVANPGFAHAADHDYALSPKSRCMRVVTEAHASRAR
jgi:hypothetical protein